MMFPGINKWAVSILLLFVFIGCNTHDGNNDQLLTKNPYKGLTDSIHRFPQMADLFLQRGLLLSQNNQHELANADYKKASELSPSASTILPYVSNLLMLNRVKQAVTLLNESITKYPNDPEFRRRISDIYIQTGAFEKALEEYNRMLEVDSLDFETWHNKGAVLIELKDTLEGIKAFEQSFRLQPIQYTGLKLADIYASMKNPRALQICDEMLARDSGGVATDALFAKGMYYSETNQYDKALEAFNACVSRDWTMVDAHIEKGIILFSQKKYDEALKIFTTAASVANTNADAYFWMGRCFEVNGKKEDAILNYNRALSLDPMFDEARTRRKKLE
ncbi:MAG TPA: tetratricopeptide repeat protein [Flavitalea sp.]|nr:tetratricopeptide repeat protein [Flavitalea sp.]